MGAVFVLALSLTGLLLWWPGVRAWRGALAIRSKSNWKGFNWQLHTVIGLWTLPLVFMFGVVGIYAGFPAPLQAFVNKIAPLDFYRPIPEASLVPRALFVAVSTPAGAPVPRRRFQPRYSTGDKIIRWFSYLHFGNFGGWWSKTLWTIIGLAPAFLFVTGFIMWCNRVLRPRARAIIAPWAHTEAFSPDSRHS